MSSYEKYGFQDGQTLGAAGLIHIEDGLQAAEDTTELNLDILDAAKADATLADLVNYNQRVNAQVASLGMTSVLTEMEVGYIGQDGQDASSSSSRRVVGYIPVTPNSKLYVKSDGAHNVYVRLYDTGKAYLRTVSVLTTSTDQEKKSTLGADVAYIRPTIQNVGVDGDVYAIDWAVCVGTMVVLLESASDITTLPVGEYYSDTSTTPTLVNSPVASVPFRLRIIERYNANNMAIIFAQNGEMFIRFNLTSTGAWYKFTGTAV